MKLEESKYLKRVHFVSLENWRTRRIDKKVELYWAKVRKDQGGELSSYQEYQETWNFRESDYHSSIPSNNGLDFINPAFAFTTNLTKYIRHMSCVIVDGSLIDIRYEDEKHNSLRRTRPQRAYPVGWGVYS